MQAQVDISAGTRRSPGWYRTDAGEDGIRVECVVVAQRNLADQVVREVEIERTFEDGVVRQTTVRAVGFDTLTSQAHELRALPADEARSLIADAEARGMLTVPSC